LVLVIAFLIAKSCILILPNTEEKTKIANESHTDISFFVIFCFFLSFFLAFSSFCYYTIFALNVYPFLNFYFVQWIFSLKLQHSPGIILIPPLPFIAKYDISPYIKTRHNRKITDMPSFLGNQFLQQSIKSIGFYGFTV
jgi:hypothetical protein